MRYTRAKVLIDYYTLDMLTPENVNVKSGIMPRQYQ